MPIEIPLSPLIDAVAPAAALLEAVVAVGISVLIVIAGCAVAATAIKRDPTRDRIDRALYAILAALLIGGGCRCVLACLECWGYVVIT